MSDEPVTLNSTAWWERIEWLILLRVFRIAVSFHSMWLAALGIVLTAAGWWAAVWLFWGDPSRIAEMPEAAGRMIEDGGYSDWPWQVEAVDRSSAEKAGTGDDGPTAPPSADLPVDRSPRIVEGVVSGVLGRDVRPEEADWLTYNPIFGSWLSISRPFRGLPAARLDLVRFSFLLLCGIWAVAVWSLFGGAISRIAAMRLCLDEKIGLRQALAHAFSHWAHYFWAPISPLVFLVILSLPILAGGWLLTLDVGILIAAIIWPLFLLLGLIMAIVVIGLLFGWPLMWATISVEGTDSWDAVSRCYHYVYQRPLNFLFYASVATVLGVLGWFVVAAFAALVAYLPGWTASWTAGASRTESVMRVPSDLTGLGWPADSQEASAAAGDATGEFSSSTSRIGAAILGFWIVIVKLLAQGFAYGYFWTSATAVFLLLRRDVDAKEVDEVFSEDDEAYGLPELGVDEAGVAMAPADEGEATEEDSESKDVDAEEDGAAADKDNDSDSG